MISDIYNILSNIYRNESYANIELNSFSEHPFVTSTVYGVIEHDVELNYRIKLAAPKSPGQSEKILLKIGMYLLLYSDMAEYAAVNEVVGFAKKLKKNPSFINAVLRNFKRGLVLPQDEVGAMSIKYQYPEWAVRLLIKDYDKDTAQKIMSDRGQKLTHVRINPFKSNPDIVKEIESCAQKSAYGFFVRGEVLKKYKDYLIIQSAGSMAVCQAAKISEGDRVLDLCAAPGGKSVMLAQSAAGVSVISCDIHPHRVKLIEKYAQAAGVKLRAIVNDATVYNPDLGEDYDLVLCDVPCSGFGVLNLRPDIILKRKEEDIASLASLQAAILNTSAAYVKKGGALLYSTCTYFYRENIEVVKQFLAANPSFVIEKPKLSVGGIEIDGCLQLAPFISNTEGFFIARLKKV